FAHRAGTRPTVAADSATSYKLSDLSNPVHGLLSARCSSLAAKHAATGGLPSYLVLLRVGFALPVPLLERRCALTAPFHPYPGGRYVFCGTFRQPALKPASRTLSGTLLSGVRTFLPSRPERRIERPSGPAAYMIIICAPLQKEPIS